MALSLKPAVIVLTGASGAGKTTLLQKLGEMKLQRLECINCDRVNLGSKESDPSEHQVAILRYWLSEVKCFDKQIDLAVLDTQIRPRRAIEELGAEGFDRSAVVLIDCEPNKRNERLRFHRLQPELITHQMDCWAAYLRGQADALQLPIIDTSVDAIETSMEALLSIVNRYTNIA